MGFLLGCVPLVYFPMAKDGAGLVWGDWSEFSRLWTHLFRMEYGTLQLVPGEASARGAALVAFFNSLPTGVGWVAILLLVLGLGLQFQPKAFSNHERVRWGQGFTVGLVVYLLGFMGFMNLPFVDPNFSVLQRFLAQPYLLMGFFLAMGLDGLREWYGKRATEKTVVALMVAVLGAHVFNVLGHADRRGETFVQQHGQNILALSQPGDILLTHNDLETFTLMFLTRFLEKEVTVVAVPMLGMPWYRDRMMADLNIKANVAGVHDFINSMNHDHRLILVDGAEGSAHPNLAARFYPLGPTMIVPKAGQKTPSPLEVFQKNKALYGESAFVVPTTRPQTRVEQELLQKYENGWDILCQAMKSAGAGEMHEACSRSKRMRDLK